MGLFEDARWMHVRLSQSYTTSSEMLGECGEMVRRIYRIIPSEARGALSDLFDECELSVKRAWPNFCLDPVT